MEERELCDALLRNTTGYTRLGPLAGELKDWQTQIKVINADGCGNIFEPEFMKSIIEDADFAIETVAYTFAVHYFRNELKKTKVGVFIEILQITDNR